MDENAKKLLEQKVDFIPLPEDLSQFEWKKEGMVSGLLLPDKTIMVNMWPDTSGATLGIYRRQFQAKYVLVKGLYTFEPTEFKVQP